MAGHCRLSVIISPQLYLHQNYSQLHHISKHGWTWQLNYKSANEVVDSVQTLMLAISQFSIRCGLLLLDNKDRIVHRRHQSSVFYQGKINVY